MMDRREFLRSLVLVGVGVVIGDAVVRRLTPAPPVLDHATLDHWRRCFFIYNADDTVAMAKLQRECDRALTHAVDSSADRMRLSAADRQLMHEIAQHTRKTTRYFDGRGGHMLQQTTIMYGRPRKGPPPA